MSQKRTVIALYLNGDGELLSIVRRPRSTSHQIQVLTKFSTNWNNLGIVSIAAVAVKNSSRTVHTASTKTDLSDVVIPAISA